MPHSRYKSGKQLKNTTLSEAVAQNYKTWRIGHNWNTYQPHVSPLRLYVEFLAVKSSTSTGWFVHTN